MNKIRSWLYIGNYQDTLDITMLSKYNITTMLQLAHPTEQPAITSLYLPIRDREPLTYTNLQKGIEFILSAKTQQQNILVACFAGISRSATFVTAALKQSENISLLEALKHVIQKHPVASPHPALWQSLCVYFGEEEASEEIKE